MSYTGPLNRSNFTSLRNSSHNEHEDDFGPYIGIIVLSIITMICNAIIVFIIARSRELRKRPSNKFLLNLMVSDLSVGIVMLCFSASVMALNSEEHEAEDHKPAPAAIGLLRGVLILLSVTNMILLSGDRLYAVKWTYRYIEVFTAGNVHTAVTVPWFLSVIYFIILLSLILNGNHETEKTAAHSIYVSFDVIAIIGFIILSSSSIAIYKAARSQLRRMRKTSVIAPTGALEMEKGFTAKERRLALINIGIVGKFVLLWLPSFIAMTYHLAYQTALSPHLDYLAFYLILVNCICDPTLYVLLSRDIRTTIMSNLQRRQSAVSPIHNRNIIIRKNAGMSVVPNRNKVDN